VINMPHDGDYRGARGYARGIIRRLFNDRFVIQGNLPDGTAVLRCDNNRGIGVDRLIDRGHHAHGHQLGDDLLCRKIHLPG